MGVPFQRRSHGLGFDAAHHHFVGDVNAGIFLFEKARNHVAEHICPAFRVYRHRARFPIGLNPPFYQVHRGFEPIQHVRVVAHHVFHRRLVERHQALARWFTGKVKAALHPKPCGWVDWRMYRRLLPALQKHLRLKHHLFRLARREVNHQFIRKHLSREKVVVRVVRVNFHDHERHLQRVRAQVAELAAHDEFVAQGHVRVVFHAEQPARRYQINVGRQHIVCQRRAKFGKPHRRRRERAGRALPFKPIVPPPGHAPAAIACLIVIRFQRVSPKPFEPFRIEDNAVNIPAERAKARFQDVWQGDERAEIFERDGRDPHILVCALWQWRFIAPTAEIQKRDVKRRLSVVRVAEISLICGQFPVCLNLVLVNLVSAKIQVVQFDLLCQFRPMVCRASQFQVPFLRVGLAPFYQQAVKTDVVAGRGNGHRVICAAVVEGERRKRFDENRVVCRRGRGGKTQHALCHYFVYIRKPFRRFGQPQGSGGGQIKHGGRCAAEPILRGCR